MKTNYRASARGVLFIELLAYLAIMAVVSLLATEMVASSLRITRDCRDQDTRIHRVDTAVDALRRDVWSARTMAVTGHQVLLTGLGTAVTWRMNDGGKLTRDQSKASVGTYGLVVAVEAGPADTRTWIEMPQFSFVDRGGALQVDIASDKGVPRHESVTLACPALMGGGQ